MLPKARAAFHQMGIANGLLYFADRLLSRVSGGRARLIRYLIVAQPVSGERDSNNLRRAKCPIRVVAPEDPVVAQFPRPAPVIAARFRARSLCLVAEVREQFAGFIWLAFGGYDEDEVRCRFEFVDSNVSAWDFDVYVKPEFRMGRTFSRLWQAANEELSRRGVTWSFSRISAFNAQSIAAHRRMGSRSLRTVTFICAGNFQFALLGAPPYVHVGVSDKASKEQK